MISKLKNKISKLAPKNFQLILISTITVLYLYRSIVPPLKYPLILLMLVLLLFIVINIRKELIRNIIAFFRVIFLGLCLLIILIISLITSDKVYLVVLKDIINTFMLLIILFEIFILIKTKNDLSIFIEIFSKIAIYLGFFISILCIFNFVESIPSTILTKDYNFALVPVFFSIILISYLYRKSFDRRLNLFYCLILCINITSIILSGSRRGILTLFAFDLSIIFLLLLSWRKPIFVKIKNYSLIVIIYSISFSSALYLFSFHTSDNFKKNILGIDDFKNSNIIKVNLAIAAFKYISIVENTFNYFTIYNKIWNRDIARSYDPDSGWGNHTHETIFPLTGINVDVVPQGAKGYHLDHNTEVSEVINNESFSKTLFAAVQAKKGDLLLATVYCFVSKDFNGNSIGLKIEGANRNFFSEYQIFDSLQTTPRTKNLFYNSDFALGSQHWWFWSDSTTLHFVSTPFGNGIRLKRTNGNGVDWSLLYDGRPIIYYKEHKYQISFKFKIIKGESIPFKVGWWVNDDGQGYASSALPLKISDLDFGWHDLVCSYRFRGTYSNLMAFLNCLEDNTVVDIADVELVDLDSNDTLPQFVYSKFQDKGSWQKLSLLVKCDSTPERIYLNFSQKGVSDFSSLKGYVVFAAPEFKIINTPIIDKITLNTIIPSDLLKQMRTLFQSDSIRSIRNEEFLQESLKNHFVNGRSSRWEYAITLYKNHYNIRQKLLGGGFAFLNEFGSKFTEFNTIDYPHNPLLSILLYSGALGLGFYIIFLLTTIRYYVLYYKELPLIFICFITTYIFSFFSAGSPFDPPIMAFFMFFPFLFHNILKLEK